MTGGEKVKRIFLPAAKEDQHGTGLQFTDILFGFVISQIFVRLQYWGSLSPYVRWQLVASTALVLGSWIGFRRSLNRTEYQLKFFNLPLFRFVLDQLMVILYFRVAILTSSKGIPTHGASSLTNATVETLFFIFVLYALWDVGGLIMGSTLKSRKYPALTADPWGLVITLTFLGLFGALWCITCGTDVDGHAAGLLLAAATLLLLAYRWAKEIRSTMRDSTSENGGGAVAESEPVAP